MGEGDSNRDLYATLGVEGNATSDEIKRAFRRLAARHHPDKNPGDKAAATRFKRINAAYQVLSDPAKRGAYDKFTRPVEDEPEPAASAQTPPAARAASTKKRRSPAEEQVPERELVRDDYVVVTTQRVMFPGDRSYDVSKILGAHFVHHSRGLATLVAGSGLLVGAILVGADDHLRTATTLGVVGASSLVRFFSRSTKYTARLVLAGGNADSPASPNAAWARDIVRAIESAARVKATAISTSNGWADALGGAVAAAVVVAVFWTIAGQFNPPKRPSDESVVTADDFAPARPTTYAAPTVEPRRRSSVPTMTAAPRATPAVRPRAAAVARPTADPCGDDPKCRCLAKSGCPECVRTCQANSSSSLLACTRFCLTDSIQTETESPAAQNRGDNSSTPAGGIERTAPF